MTRKTLLSIAAVVFQGCATSAPQWSTAKIPLSSSVPEAQPGSPGAAAHPDPDNTFICEVERPTGSNIAVRTCRTVRQVEAERRAARERMMDLQRTAAQCDEVHPCGR